MYSRKIKILPRYNLYFLENESLPHLIGSYFSQIEAEEKKVVYENNMPFKHVGIWWTYIEKSG